MSEKISYASYLLRIWREGDEPDAWQGEIESIQSGQKWQFDNLESIIGFLQTQVLAASITDPAQEEE